MYLSASADEYRSSFAKKEKQKKKGKEQSEIHVSSQSVNALCECAKRQINRTDRASRSISNLNSYLNWNIIRLIFPISSQNPASNQLQQFFFRIPADHDNLQDSEKHHSMIK